MKRKHKIMIGRIVISSILTIILAINPMDLEKEPLFFLYLVPYLIIGYDVLIKAVKGIKNLQALDENFLMTVATLGAMALGFTYTGDYNEAVAVMIFYQIGELFQALAVEKSRTSISKLLEIRPDSAFVEEDGELVEVDPDDVEVGSVIVVRPGDRVPIDGKVVSGSSSLNTSALTGESIPRDVTVGDEVLSGSINLSGVLKIETTRDFGDSTVSKILDMVENASGRKSKSEALITKFAKVYTPFVVACAILVATVPPIASMIMGIDPEVQQWIYRALTFLVISCPCALVISVPLGFFAGLGGASREGILIKGSNYLEALAETEIVVFDKTGTLTKGVFEVTEVKGINVPEEKMIELAALAESSSPHPIASSLIVAYGKDIDRNRITSVEDISGKGVIAVVDGIKVAVGNSRLMEHIGLQCEDEQHIGTTVHVALNGVYAGSITISDMIKEESKEAVRYLKGAGVKRTVMLSGDRETVAEKVSAEIGLDEFHGNLLPGDKLSELERLLKETSVDGTVAFVGDGINDAPSLVRSDIGITMGSIGSDAAIEASDVVIMDDDPRRIATAIGISRKCIRIVNTNIFATLVVKFGFLALSVFGLINMWLAILADVGIMIVAVLNSARALRYKNREAGTFGAYGDEKKDTVSDI